jgi:glycosyltransferase involved in cell wall biosynthesis
LSLQGDVETTFCLPKPTGEEEKFLKILGMNQVPIVWRDVDYDYLKSRLPNYTSPEEYYSLRDHIYADFSYMHVNDLGCMEFAGGYPKNLHEEINNCSIIAGVVARQQEFDIIHAHDWLTYFAGIAAKRVSGKPLVVHMHATSFDRSSSDNIDTRVYEIERAGMAAADMVIAVSNLTRNIVIDKYHIEPEKVVAVHNAVQFAENDNPVPERGVDDKIVTFLGRITFQKGPDYFIEAAAKVLARVPNVRFVMAGSGDMMNHCIRRVAQLGISDRFHFTGFLKGDDVQKMFQLSDVYIMPSVSEPFGISPLEAMRSNVPTIISHQSGVAEVLDYAVKVNYWDVDAMADAIYGLITYPALAKMFQEKGMEEVNNLKWFNAATKIKDVYQQAIDKCNK